MPSPVKLSIYPKRTNREWKLIDKKPFRDTDKDKVFNILDCKPLNRKKQDFGVFKYQGRETESFTAAERFGGANLKKLKRLGAGRDRVVLQLDKDKVVKIAKNPGGIKQNLSESDLGGYLNQLKHHESGKDYVVMEKVNKPSKEFTRKLSKLNEDRYTKNYSKYGIATELAAISNPDIEELQNYEFSEGDILKKSSWGDKDGKPVLIDAGGINKESISSHGGQGHQITKLKQLYNRTLQQRRESIEDDASDFSKAQLPRIETGFHNLPGKPSPQEALCSSMLPCSNF